ncbi:MAG: NAD(P)/FAD-dependent oxidoreductase, partial [Mycetocola sp.]
MINEDFVRRAVDQADLNALRLALFHATGDISLTEMRLESVSVRGGATTMVVVAPEHHEELKAAAVDFLLQRAAHVTEVTPDDAHLRSMMEALTGEQLTDKDFAYRRDVAAFDEVPREVRWSAKRPAAADGFEVIIIGAGFSGIAAGVQLARLGIPFTIYERRHELGGTWSVNIYPDARVDTTNFVYAYSFEKKYPWTQYFSRHDEVRQYLEHVAKKYDVFDHICFNSDVKTAVFDESTDRWAVSVLGERGELDTAEANIVVAASGLFGVPRAIDFEGAHEFEGEIVHTTAWTPETTVEGKRVAVIGNGSTGVQLLSKVASDAAHVDVYQRTPQWISPRENYGSPISEETRWLIDSMPYYYNWYIYQMIAMGLGTQDLQEPDPEWKAAGGFINEKNDMFRANLEHYIRSKLGDHVDLIEQVTPDYAPIARRLIVDNNWYTTLLEDHVELVKSPIVKLTPAGIVTADGVEHPTDFVVAAIGFTTTKYLWPTEFVGVGGVRMEDRWEAPGSGGPRAHLSLTVPDFPNMFIMYGPNSQPRSGSLISWVEIWARYIAESAVTMIENGWTRMSVREEAFEDYNAKLDRASSSL